MKNQKKIDIYRILAQRGAIAIVWDIDLVKKVRPDLTDSQAWEVLEQVEVEHDRSLGITWQTLEIAAKDLFGSPPDDDE